MSNPNNASPVRAGDVLDRKYRIERVLGIGGMGVVVAARHLELGTRVAIKFLLARTLEDAASVQRFAREARAAVRLQSEHAAHVLDVGRLEDGAPYMVMELLVGRDLATKLGADGPLPPEEAAEYILQACQAIAEAHVLGIIHRDLKPANLFLTKRADGRPLVKVLDFGLAKSQKTLDQGLTGSLEIMGSPSYMSPEQLRAARDVDARTDVWSLGVCLYELLTNTLPFDAQSLGALCAQIITGTPRRLRESRPELSQDLEEVVARCLANEPNDRFADVVELADSLGACVKNVSGATRVADVARTTSANHASGSSAYDQDDVAPNENPAVGDTVPVRKSTGTQRATSIDTLASTKRAARPGRRLRSAVVAFAALAVVFAVVFTQRNAHRPASASTPPVAALPEMAVVPPSPASPPSIAPTSSAVASAVPILPSASASAIVGRAPSAAGVRTPSRPKPRATNCDPPYVLDSSGLRVAKPECL